MRRTELYKYRGLKRKHLIHGIGSIKDRAAYFALGEEVRDAVGGMPGIEGEVMRAFFLEGRTVTSIARQVNYSESQVCRIRQAALDRMEREE